MENKGNGLLVMAQQFSVLYLVIWTITPFMEIDLIWRLGALGAALLWLICAMNRGLVLERIHVLASYMLVLFFIMFYFYKERWKELYFIIPIVLLFLIYFNFRSAFTVMNAVSIT